MKRSDDYSGGMELNLSEFTNDSSSEKLRQKGIYYITGDIEPGSLLEIHQDILLKHLDPKWSDDIQLIINSCGGETGEGWALVDLLDWVKMDISTTGLGMCASMGAVLLSCGTPGKRTVGKNTSIMVHGAYIGGVDGNYQQLIAATIDMKHEFDRAVNFWQEHSCYKTEEEIKKFFLNGFDHYWTPEEALAHGIIDTIVGQSKTKK